MIRRVLLNRLIYGAGVLLLIIGAWLMLGPERQQRASQEQNALEGARRVITYDLSDTAPIEFGLLPGHKALRMVTTANFDAKAVSNLPDPVRANYVIEYITTDVYGEEAEPRYLHETAYLNRERSNLRYLDDVELPASGQVVLFDLESTPLREVSFRLANMDDTLGSVGLRVNAEEEVSERETGFRWQRLRRDQQATLFRGSVYPPEFARRDERRLLTKTRWVPIGPSGIEGRNFQRKFLYVTEEEVTEPEESLVIPGLYTSPLYPGVIPIPPGGGEVLLRFVGIEKAARVNDLVLVTYFPDELSEPVTQALQLKRGLGLFRQQLAEGELLVKVPRPMSVNAELRTDDEVMQITPTPPLTPTWIVEGGSPVSWQLTSADSGRVPVRVDLRLPIADHRTNGSNASVRISMRDAQGRSLTSSEHEVAYQWQPFERSLSEQYWDIGGAARLYFLLPPGTESLRVESDNPVGVSVSTRPPLLPYRVRVPTDYSPYPLDPPRPLIWFSIEPESSQEMILARKRQFVASSPRVQAADPDLVAGNFEFVMYSPDEILLGRDLLIPSGSNAPPKPGAEGSWFRPLKPGVQRVSFSLDEEETLVPNLIWRNDAAGGRLRLRLDDTVLVDERLSGRQGVIQLGQIPAGSHVVSAEFPDSMAVYLSHAGKAAAADGGPNRLRRYATQLRQGLGSISYTFRKTSPRETITMAIHRSPDAPAVRLEASLIGQTPITAQLPGYTPRRRVYELSPADPAEQSWVLGSSKLVDAGERLFFVLGEDIPQGEYRLQLQMGEGFDGYISVYQLQTGQGEKVSFSLDRLEG